jgi:adenine-specific DNA-methyltransferase
MRYKAQYLGNVPVPNCSSTRKVLFDITVDYLLGLNCLGSINEKNNHGESDAQIGGYFEKLLDGLVCELFFPDDLHSHKINLFKHVEEAWLPALVDIPEKQRFSRLEEIYERISDDRHPIRGCLESLKSLEVVRIIEGVI